MTDDERNRRRIDEAIETTQTTLDEGALIRASMAAVATKLQDAFSTLAKTEIDLASMIDTRSRPK